MPRPLHVTAAQQALVDEYVAARDRGDTARSQASYAARWFLGRFGTPAGWRSLTVAEQQRLPEIVKAFVCWLLLRRPCIRCLPLVRGKPLA